MIEITLVTLAREAIAEICPELYEEAEGAQTALWATLEFEFRVGARIA